MFTFGPSSRGVLSATPSEIPGSTGWWNFTQVPGRMYQDANALARPTTECSADGQYLRWTDTSDLTLNGTNFYYPVYNVSTPAGFYKTNIVNGKSVYRANGTLSTVADFNKFQISPWVSLGRYLNTEAFTVGAKTVIGAVYARAGSPYPGGNYGNKCIFGDSAINRWMLGLVDDITGTSLVLRGYNYSSGEQKVDQPIAKNAWFIFAFKHDGTNIKLRVNGGAWASTASGATTDGFGGGPTFCHNGSNGTSGDIDVAHIAFFNTAVSDGNIRLVEQYFSDSLAIPLV